MSRPALDTIDICSKCGYEPDPLAIVKWDIEYECQHIGTHDNPNNLADEWLLRRCHRCGFSWQERCLTQLEHAERVQRGNVGMAAPIDAPTRKIPEQLFERLVRTFKEDEPFKISWCEGVAFHVRLRSVTAVDDDTAIELRLTDFRGEAP